MFLIAEFPTAECTFDVASDTVNLPTLPAPPPAGVLFAESIGNTATSCTQAISYTGGRLALEGPSVAASLPEGALSRGRNHTLYLCVMREDRCRPKFPEGNYQIFNMFVISNSII